MGERSLFVGQALALALGQQRDDLVAAGTSGHPVQSSAARAGFQVGFKRRLQVDDPVGQGGE
ncbi:MAG: hypothetical protein CMJ47_02130 [Planctomyces sp.]|nr:hypothetical protein [Planctomyces sp.]